MSGHDSKYFSTTKKGEIPELKEELNSQYKDKRKDAVKKVIAAMTVGKDVSSLFIHILAGQWDAFADKITEYLCDPLQRCLKDDDPYVRKTAAICVAKLYDINAELVEDRGFQGALKDLISDNNPMVVANAIAALAEIQENNSRPIFEITSHALSKLLTALNECTAWGQVFILDALSKYKAADARKAENIMILLQMELITSTDVVRNLCKKMAPPLVTLLSAEPEIQYVALCNINLTVQKRPTILAHEIKVFFCKYNDPIYVKMEKLEIMIKLASDRNIDQVLLEFKGYATEVDVDFVRKAVRAIERCAIKLERAAERCISVLLELIKIKVNYVVQEAIIVTKDIFRRYPNTYESIIATLCKSLDTLDETEANFLETFPEEPPQVQLQLQTATVKLLLKKPTEGPQQMIQVILNNATVETDNPNLRDRAYIYCGLVLYTFCCFTGALDAAKDVILAEKPVINDDSNQLDPSLLDELLANIATLSYVYHKRLDAFVTCVKTLHTTEEEYYPGEGGPSESPALAAVTTASPPATTGNSRCPAGRQPAAAPAAPAPVPDLVDLMGTDNDNTAAVSTNQPASPAAPPLPVLLSASAGQGLQISAQLIRRDGHIYYNMFFENNSQIPLDGFMIHFNKNPLGLAAGGPLQVPQVQPGTSASTPLPMVLFQNVSPGPPSTLLQVAVKNNQQPEWYFNDKISLHLFLMEDGRMERSTFLETWKSLPDSNEISKDFPAIVVSSVEATLDQLAASNVFFIAKLKHANQEVLYLSAKIPQGIPFLIELTAAIGIPGLKCAIKTPSPDMASLVFDAIETLLKG
ncbi:Vesicle coat complex AP-1/AP-2/AP-4, beta subunit [Handroanthus impetiginosus]|uniref:Vesicle coat complex AP-1/AP-2/AP-4, beta subunit n=1 Tax=Handroanthus impetiginosus TaxID=429701 RepID=A0A2G9HQ79_9LAMI|nr:Vesicle coat complex AP-1/AP-2/AP-4, beta subunit [Handroanthus impetiginosus]